MPCIYNHIFGAIHLIMDIFYSFIGQKNPNLLFLLTLSVFSFLAHVVLTNTGDMFPDSFLKKKNVTLQLFLMTYFKMELIVVLTQFLFSIFKLLLTKDFLFHLFPFSLQSLHIWNFLQKHQIQMKDKGVNNTPKSVMLKTKCEHNRNLSLLQFICTSKKL